MYCKNCRFYNPNEDKDTTCLSLKVQYGYKAIYQGMATLPEGANLVVENDEGWGMIPSPDFGCVNFEVKNVN